MVFQHPMATLNPVMPVGRQIIEAVRAVKAVTREQAAREGADLLEEMGIADARRRMHDYPHEFSGGQRQRIVIAIAVAGEPALLLADEPTSALDVTTQASILKIFARIKRERGTAIVLVSHNYAVVSQLCSRTVVLYAGQTVEQGPTSGVLRSPAHPYTAGLIECLPSVDARRERLPVIPGEPPSADAMPTGCPFAPRCRHRAEPCDSMTMSLRPVAAERESACIRIGAPGDLIGIPSPSQATPGAGLEQDGAMTVTAPIIDLLLRQCRVEDQPNLVDIAIQDGRIHAIGPALVESLRRARRRWASGLAGVRPAAHPPRQGRFGAGGRAQPDRDAGRGDLAAAPGQADGDARGGRRARGYGDLPGRVERHHVHPQPCRR